MPKNEKYKSWIMPLPPFGAIPFLFCSFFPPQTLTLLLSCTCMCSCTELIDLSACNTLSQKKNSFRVEPPRRFWQRKFPVWTFPSAHFDASSSLVFLPPRLWSIMDSSPLLFYRPLRLQKAFRQHTTTRARRFPVEKKWKKNNCFLRCRIWFWLERQFSFPPWAKHTLYSKDI